MTEMDLIPCPDIERNTDQTEAWAQSWDLSRVAFGLDKQPEVIDGAPNAFEVLAQSEDGPKQVAMVVQANAWWLRLLSYVHRGGATAAYRKLCVLHYYLAPEKYGGKSMAEVAEASGFSKQSFDQFASAFRERFGIRPALSRSPAAVEKMRQAQKHRWQKKKPRLKAGARARKEGSNGGNQ